MLKIIMGSEYADQYIPKDKEFIEFPSKSFTDLKESKWFKDELVKQIIEKIDKAYVEADYSVHSIKYDLGYSVDELAGGSKFLIMVHMLRDYIYLATMGDNCTDFLENIAADYERKGNDLVIVSNYLHKFQFNYIKSIEYINWGIVCHSYNDIYNKVYDKWIEQDKSEDTEDDDEYFARLDKELDWD